MTLLGQVKKIEPVRWGEAKDDVRFIHIKPNEEAAVYVIEEPPGPKIVKFYGDGPKDYKVTTPWMYFFVHVTRDRIADDKKGAYVLFSKEQAKTVDDECLLIPLFPNLFKHGGICINHSTSYRASTPLNTARLLIGWFWDSSGGSIFTAKDIPEELGGPGAWPYSKIFEKWSSMTEEEVAKIQWNQAAKRSIRSAAERLSFNYWSRSGTTTDDTLQP